MKKKLVSKMQLQLDFKTFLVQVNFLQNQVVAKNGLLEKEFETRFEEMKKTYDAKLLALENTNKELVSKMVSISFERIHVFCNSCFYFYRPNLIIGSQNLKGKLRNLKQNW